MEKRGRYPKQKITKKEMYFFLKSEIEILALKSNNLSEKQKKVPESINNSYELNKGKISKPEDRSVKNIQSEIPKMKKNEEK